MDAKDIAEELQDANVDAIEEVASEAPPEKMLPQSRVNELVQKAKRDKERQMQEKLDAAMAQIQELQGSQQQPTKAPEGQTQSPPGIDVQALQAEVMQRIEAKQKEDEQKRYNDQLEQEVNQVATQYFGKMAQGKDLYEDFHAITADFNPAEFPQLVFLANEMDNTPAVIYELAKNPSKLAAIDRLVERSPNMARAELAKLSESIKRNVEAKQNLQEPQDPLSRLKPSPVGTDNGTKNVRDFKKSNFLRA
jgi:hypothetical protein